ncbi:hypothetical protein BDV93DRAFT_561125 [Ceratobasidium sp. AG-I]|nr:hypothetical protein BDV93DRAFT_561125 [Ceratobasidium sp. AG-I]
MSSTRRALYVLLTLTSSALSWTIPHINVPTYTYQCMPIQISWTDGTPPYTIWFNPVDGLGRTEPVAGYGAWYNLTGQIYIVPCMAPTGSRLTMALKDSTGWISTSSDSFVVLPSTDSSCLSSPSNNAAGLSQSQSTLSTILWDFQQSVISAVSVSATATATIRTITAIASSSFSSSRSATRTVVPATAALTTIQSASPTATQGATTRSDLSRLLGPILGSLVGLILGILLTACFLRRRRKQNTPFSDAHIPLSSTSGFDLLSGDSEGHGRQDMRESRAAGADMAGSRRARTDGGTGTDTRDADLTGTAAQTTLPSAPGSRLRLHNASATAWPSTAKHRLSDVPPLPNEPPGDVDGEPRTVLEDPPQPPQRPAEPQSLEQRAEQLSAPELERLAALVARRLERVRGAPPQYQATEGVGV